VIRNSDVDLTVAGENQDEAEDGQRMRGPVDSDWSTGRADLDDHDVEVGGAHGRFAIGWVSCVALDATTQESVATAYSRTVQSRVPSVVSRFDFAMVMVLGLYLGYTLWT